MVGISSVNRSSNQKEVMLILNKEETIMAEGNFKFLEKTRPMFQRIENSLQQSETLSDKLWQDLEKNLLAADIGPQTSLWLMQLLQQRVRGEQLNSGSQIYMALRQELIGLFRKSTTLYYSERSPVTVMMVMGTPGSGKTTSVAKLAYHLSNAGQKVLLIAADTFRPGHIDPLKIWGERINVPVILQSNNVDPDTVVHNALQSAFVQKYNVVLIDTAGRWATEKNRMGDLKSIINAAQNVIPDAPRELLMVIDATRGQDGPLLASGFVEYTGSTSVILSKIDSTAKGGCAFAIADNLGSPIKFLGIGEKIEQLIPFEPASFVSALFEEK
jgi:fused signal recognition particle receptor